MEVLLKDYIGLFGGVVAVSVLLHYTYNVIRGRVVAASVASWLMWSILDIILLVTTWQAGKPVWLPLGWTVGSGLITISLLKRGQWVWQKTETLSALCALTAAIVWLTQGAVAGIVAGTLAMNFAGFPLLMEMVKRPIRATFHVWFVTCVACALTLIASDGSFAGTFLPWMSLGYNGLLSVLVLRQKDSVKWELIKNHLELEGLEAVALHHPEFWEEAEQLAAPKRLVSKFMKAVRPTRS